MTQTLKTKVLIIGAGTGGYVAGAVTAPAADAVPGTV